MTAAVIIIGGAEIGARKVDWARASGLYTVVVDRNASAPGMKKADLPLQVDRSDEYQISAQALLHAEHLDYKGVYCGIDLGIKPTIIAHALGVPTITLQAATMSQHKWLMKKQWLEQGIATPAAVLGDSERQVKRMASEWGFPLVLKAPSSSGSRGIMRIDSQADIPPAIHHIRRWAGNLEPFLVERCVNGSMHDVNGLFWNNRFYPCGIMDRYFLPESPCMSACTFDPSKLPDEHRKSIYRLLESGARALGINAGPVKGDVVRTDESFLLLEIAPRFHGDIQTVQTSVLGPGINACLAYFRALSTGEVDRSLLQARERCAGWKLIPADRHGVYQGLQGKERALEIPGVERIFEYRKPGQAIGPLTDNAQIPGVVIATASNRAQLERILAEAVGVMSVVVK